MHMEIPALHVRGWGEVRGVDVVRAWREGVVAMTVLMIQSSSEVRQGHGIHLHQRHETPLATTTAPYSLTHALTHSLTHSLTTLGRSSGSR